MAGGREMIRRESASAWAEVEYVTSILLTSESREVESQKVLSTHLGERALLLLSG